MNDVSCRLVRGFHDFLQSRGHDPAVFFKKVAASGLNDPNLNQDFLLNGRNYISWDAYVTICEVLGTYIPDRKSQEEFFEVSVGLGSSWMPLRKAAHLIASPHKFLHFYLKYIVPVAFGRTMTVIAEETADGRLRVKCIVPPERKGSQFFFVVSGIGFEKMPLMIGYPDAIVETTCSERYAEYLITLPRSRTIWSRVQREMRSLLFPKAAFEELEAQDRRIREDYARLVTSESELRDAKERLEIRIAERTQELREVNSALEQRLEELSRKVKENHELQDRLIHAQKLDAVGTLAGGISHEINNVLHGVLLSIDAAERELLRNGLKIDSMASAKRFATRGQNVMKQVLAFSRKQQFRLKPVPMLATIRQAVELMRSALSKNIEIVEDYASDVATLFMMGDETQLQQVVVNLCTNSAYAMRLNGGRIKVSFAKKGDKEAVLAVADTGSGIPEIVGRRIFEPFFTTKPVGEGSGMGLAVVHGIVRSLGGEINFISEPSATCFQVVLPTHELNETKTEDDNEIDLTGGSENLLVVDDESELLGLLADTLSVFGYNVQTATNAEDALSIFQRASIDLVLTDWMMPLVSGVELARSIKALKPQTPVILCTGLSQLDLKDEDRQFLNACVSKPLDGLTLNQLIRGVLSN